MSPYQYVCIVLSITFSLIIFNDNMHLAYALNGGFTVELIHRDSPKSPFYNSSETHFERMTNAFHRSFVRAEIFYPEYGLNSKVVQATTTKVNGEYLVMFSIGTPKFDVVASIDTGSDIVWVQCQPCTICYKQTAPLFDPSKSKTYKNVLCTSRACDLVKNIGCRKGGLMLTCQYQLSYGDGSTSSGDVAQDTFTFDTNVKNSPIKLEKIIFGCGHNNQGIFQATSAGVVGLGNNPTSLASQLGTIFDNKFSY